MKSSWKAFSTSAFHGHLFIPLKEASIVLVSSMSHAFLVDTVVGEIIELVVISVHSLFSCCLSGNDSTSDGAELSTVVLVCKCLIQPATFTSIPCIISNSLSCSVCLMPYLTSSISSLSLLLIKSLKTLAMMDFSMLVRGL